MPRKGADPASRLPIARLWPLYLAAPIVLSGLQGLLPILAEMQDALDLSDTEIGLVTSLYLLPSVLLALPIGFLADRIGRRVPLVASLAVFGLGGAIVTVWPEAFYLLLGVRVVQGVAFAAVLSLTITMIGDALSGPDQITAHGYRSLAMKIGEGVFPLLGGLLAALAWYAPFALQIAALPLALIIWMNLRGIPDARERRRGRGRALLRSLNDLSVVVLQASGFLRFFFKFAFLTYFPVLAAQRGLSPAAVGAILAGAASAGAVMGLFTGRLARWILPSLLIAASLSAITLAFVGVALSTQPAVLVASAAVFGLADGVYGILQNAAVTHAVPESLRAAFVGVSGTIRNAGKFAAPTLIGALVLVLPIGAAFLVVAGIAGLTILTAFPLRRFDPLMGAVTGRSDGSPSILDSAAE